MGEVSLTVTLKVAPADSLEIDILHIYEFASSKPVYTELTSQMKMFHYYHRALRKVSRMRNASRSMNF